MKYFYIIILLFLGIIPTFADTTSTHTFIFDVTNSVTVNVTGNMTSTIDTETGDMTTPLNINFNIVSNANLTNIQLKALVTDSSSNLDNAIYCNDTTSATSLPLSLVLANTTYTPLVTAISDCETTSSTFANNPNAIAYSGTVSIDNGGTLSYSSSNGYINANINTGTSNLNLALTTSAKAGTYDNTNYSDEVGDYKVEVYLDNIP